MLRKLLNSEFALRLFEVVDRRSENRMTEFGMLAQAFEFAKINGVAGDYFEFGVWRGKTFCYARKMARRYGFAPVRYYAFDSFEGLPEVHDENFEIWSAGQFACDMESFSGILKRNGFRDDEYELIPGFYDQSLTPELGDRLKAQDVRASIVYIDCDLYESTVPVLDFIAAFVQSGTVICFDDYFNYRGLPGYGEQKAIEEFREKRPDILLMPFMSYSPLGMSFIVAMKSDIPETVSVSA